MYPPHYFLPEWSEFTTEIPGTDLCVYGGASANPADPVGRGGRKPTL